jgi:molybdopterin-guanine dinucleotide biosynthesis protein A
MRALPADLRIALVASPAGADSDASKGHPEPQRAPEAQRIRLEAPAWDARERRAALSDCDLILSEGRPDPDRPGILVLAGMDQGNTNVTGGGPAASAKPAEASFADPARPALLACIGSARPPGLPSTVPVHPADNPAALAALLLEHLRSRAAPVYGLVLGGGRSERMGTDKAALEYHGKPQTRRCLELLAPFCDQAFVSCRAEQTGEGAFAGLPQIHDSFLGFGPLGGILSALRAHPGAAFLVVACDLPFLDADALRSLKAGRDSLKVATAFAGPQNGLPEPLCAIYEPRAYARALQLMGQGLDCPRKLILNSSAALLTPPDARALRNVNDPGEFREARASL